MGKPIVYERVEAKSSEEAIARCSMEIGQLVRISKLTASGNTEGNWTVHPSFETLDEADTLSLEEEG